MKPVSWADTSCVIAIEVGDGHTHESMCKESHRHTFDGPMFETVAAARAAIDKGPPWPCHKCLMRAAATARGLS